MRILYYFIQLIKYYIPNPKQSLSFQLSPPSTHSHFSGDFSLSIKNSEKIEKVSSHFFHLKINFRALWSDPVFKWSLSKMRNQKSPLSMYRSSDILLFSLLAPEASLSSKYKANHNAATIYSSDTVKDGVI
jgi:hypothetical protein